MNLLSKLKSFSLKTKILLLCGALVVLGLISVPVVNVISAAAVKRDLPIYCVEKNTRVVSFSFDAAWGNEDTQQLIDILGKYNIKATFFVVGDWVDKYPESVKALHDAGHEVMNHSDDHAHMTKLSADQICANIKSCNDKIQAVTGVRPTLFRAPYGEYDDKLVGASRSMEMYTIQWDVDSLDWQDKGADKIYDRVTSRVKPGSIVLFHNAAKYTPEALPRIIETLVQKGYTFVPISQLILHEDFEVDYSGKQIPVKAQ